MVLIEELAGIVGASHILTDPDLTEAFTTDWTRRFAGPAVAVVRPADTAQVAQVVARCAAYGVPILAQGGNTGLVGGSVPNPQAPPPVILSTRRLSWLSNVDQHTGQVIVGAGATLADVQRHAAAAGWLYGVDIAARDSATIGGTAATNAGGIHVCAFGMTRHQIVGIRAVLADGEVIEHLNGLVKDNTGYDWPSLLVGSEGTLAVITAVRLRLHPPVPTSTVALVGVRSYDEALHLTSLVSTRSGVPASSGVPANGARLLAAEVMDRRGIQLTGSLVGLGWPLQSTDWPLLLLVEVVGVGINLPADADAVVAVDRVDAARLWSYRERQSEAASTLGIIHKLDVSLPLDRLQRFTSDLAALLAADPTVTDFTVFGHIADGNLHLEIAGPAPDDERVDAAVLALVAIHSGSISGEHGIGRAKAAYLSLSRSPQEIAIMRAIKTAFDPHGLLAPGVIFPPSG